MHKKISNRAKCVWSPFAYRKSVKIQNTHSNQQPHSSFLHPGPTRNLHGSKCSTESVYMYCNPSAAGGCSSTYTGGNLSHHRPSNKDVNGRKMPNYIPWTSNRLKSLWIFMCDATVQMTKPFTCNGAKNKESEPAYGMRTQTLWNRWHILWGEVIQDVGHTCRGPWRSASRT